MGPEEARTHLLAWEAGHYAVETGCVQRIPQGPLEPVRVWVPRTLARPLIAAFAAGRSTSRSPSIARQLVSRWGLPTRVFDARGRAELAGGAHAV